MDLIEIIKKGKKNKKKIYNFYLSKTGTYHKYTYLYRNELCLYGVLNNYYNYYNILFPNLIKYNKINIDNINNINLNILLLYEYAKNKNLYYINYIFNKTKTYKYFFIKNNEENSIIRLFIANIYRNKVKDLVFFKDAKILFTFNYIVQILFFYKENINNNEIFTVLFYNFYINLIKDEIKYFYDKNYGNIINYKELYIFLKEKGYVNEFYNVIVPYIKKNYKKIFKKIISDPEYIPFKKKMLKKIKPYDKIDITKIIDKYYKNKDENINIKKKLKELKKKLNI